MPTYAPSGSYLGHAPSSCHPRARPCPDSQFRQVPDNQEVWVSRRGNDSIIVELLEWEEGRTVRELAECVWAARGCLGAVRS